MDIVYEMFRIRLIIVIKEHLLQYPLMKTCDTEPVGHI